MIYAVATINTLPDLGQFRDLWIIQCGFELRVVPFSQGIQDICRDCVVKAFIEKVEKLK